MKVWAIECKFKVPGGRWLLWSGTHFYKTLDEAEKRRALLAHKQHPVPCAFRVRPYGPL